MQVPPTDRIAAFRPLGAEQLSLAALSPAVATVRPQPVSEVDTNGPDGDATDQERANTESLVRLFTSQSGEATYERQIQRAQREQAQALERRLEAGVEGAGAQAGSTAAAGTASGPDEPASSAASPSNSDGPARAGPAQARGLEAATSNARAADPMRPAGSGDTEPAPSATRRLENGAPVPSTPSGEPLAVSRGPRPADAAQVGSGA